MWILSLYAAALYNRHYNLNSFVPKRSQKIHETLRKIMNICVHDRDRTIDRNQTKHVSKKRNDNTMEFFLKEFSNDRTNNFLPFFVIIMLIKYKRNIII